MVEFVNSPHVQKEQDFSELMNCSILIPLLTHACFKNRLTAPYINGNCHNNGPGSPKNGILAIAQGSTEITSLKHSSRMEINSAISLTVYSWPRSSVKTRYHLNSRLVQHCIKLSSFVKKITLNESFDQLLAGQLSQKNCGYKLAILISYSKASY